MTCSQGTQATHYYGRLGVVVVLLLLFSQQSEWWVSCVGTGNRKLMETSLSRGSPKFPSCLLCGLGRTV